MALERVIMDPGAPGEAQRVVMSAPELQAVNGNGQVHEQVSAAPEVHPLTARGEARLAEARENFNRRFATVKEVVSAGVTKVTRPIGRAICFAVGASGAGIELAANTVDAGVGAVARAGERLNQFGNRVADKLELTGERAGAVAMSGVDVARTVPKSVGVAATQFKAGSANYWTVRASRGIAKNQERLAKNEAKLAQRRAQSAARQAEVVGHVANAGARLERVGLRPGK